VSSRAGRRAGLIQGEHGVNSAQMPTWEAVYRHNCVHACKGMGCMQGIQQLVSSRRPVLLKQQQQHLQLGMRAACQGQGGRSSEHLCPAY